MKFIYLLFSLISFQSCFLYCPNLELTAEDKEWTDIYQIGQTITFKSNRNHVQKFKVNYKKTFYSNCVESNKHEQLSLVLTKENCKDISIYCEVSLLIVKNKKGVPCVKFFSVYDLKSNNWNQTDTMKHNLIMLSTTDKLYDSFLFEDNISAYGGGSNSLKSFNWSKEFGLIRYTTYKGEVFELCDN